MTIKQIEEEFSKKIDFHFQHFGAMTNNKIQQFYRQKMKEWSLDCVGEDMTGEGSADEQQFSFGFVSGYNQRGEEIRERIKQEIPE